ncbi:pentatricopeptide repeat-containing protein 1, mitochondrial isoform X2 [Ornithorhynchus anatinus]|uniref:pentatricopeptide repeat-containing protein 1, mitochondrial isoform X2 n=1 Tax=Ornithorhynchus anatinus TaxID=9258 RepID=UPI0019D4C4C4|nr:pentatricopeptide repeat-containing protein 1, mitochondrial isoform X2 [Ornithorhynchus anatinus]
MRLLRLLSSRLPAGSSAPRRPRSSAPGSGTPCRWGGRPPHASARRRLPGPSPRPFRASQPLAPPTGWARDGPAPLPRPDSEEAAEECDFGSLSDRYSSRMVFRKTSSEFHNLRLKDREDPAEQEEQRKAWRGRRNTPYWYFLRCKALIKEDKLVEALDLFERQMLKEERLQPMESNYTVLIGGCGRAGYVKKAFKLYNDEVVGKGHAVTVETLNLLLMACLQDKNDGFRYALQVWRTMSMWEIKPEGHSYNLMLRAARDCGTGNPASASDSLLGTGERRPASVQPGTRRRGPPRSGAVTLPDVEFLEERMFRENVRETGEPPTLAETEDAGRERPEPGNGPSPNSGPAGGSVPSRGRTGPEAAGFPEPVCPLPNLLDVESPHRNVVRLGAAPAPADRLALMGEAEGFLDRMEKDGVAPDIKTFTLLAEVVRPRSRAEDALLALLEKHRVEADVAFFNALVRKRSRRKDLEGAKELLLVLAQRKMCPDLQTFCNLAIGCSRKKDGLQLLKDMKEVGMHPNAHVYGTLIDAAVKRLDYAYLIAVLRDMRRARVPVNEVIVRQLEFAAAYPPKFDRYREKNTYLEKADGFRAYYKRWLQVMPGEETPHPWQRFRVKPDGAGRTPPPAEER